MGHDGYERGEGAQQQQFLRLIFYYYFLEKHGFPIFKFATFNRTFGLFLDAKNEFRA